MSLGMIGSIGARLAVSTLTLGWLITSLRISLDRIRPGRPADQTWCAIAVWCPFSLIVSAELLGAFGWLTFINWSIAQWLVGAALRIWKPRGSGVAEAERGAGADAERGADAIPGATTASSLPASRAFAIAVGGLVAGRLLYSIRNPPTDRDSIGYHLPMIAHWITSHALGVGTWVPREFGTFYPGNAELLQMWAVLSTGRDTLVGWPGIFALGIAAIALRGLMLDLGAARRVAETLAFALIAAPGVYRLSQGLYVDAFMAAWLAIGLRSMLRYRRTGDAADLTLAFAAFGLLSGCRYSNYPLVVIVIDFCCLIPRPGGRRVWPGLRPAAWLALIVPGGFWLARNVIASGNPLFPFSYALGRLRFAGVTDSSELWRTTQIAVWQAGQGGHLTVPNLWRVYGIVALGLAVGGVIWVLRAFGSRPAQRRAERVILLGVALSALALFLVSYFSGANLAAHRGQPLSLAVGNLRYLLPALVSFVPIAAAGLSLPLVLASISAATLAIFSLAQLRPTFGHVIPGCALIAVLMWIYRKPRPRWIIASTALLGWLAVSAAVVAFDSQRTAITTRAWQDLSGAIVALPPGAAERARAIARGRPIASVGVEHSIQIAGRDFAAHPVYVPVASDWSEALKRWRFVIDDRAHPDHDRWLRNLAASHAAVMVVMSRDSASAPIERRWCDADTARFRAELRLPSLALYEVPALSTGPVRRQW